MTKETLALHIEALIFSSESSISAKEIQQVCQQALETAVSEDEIYSYIKNIGNKYSGNFAIGLVEINGGFQFLTKKEFHGIINQLQIQRSKKKLSQAALETLAIIAYRQPITKLEIEQIRGVNCDYTIQKLLEKELITISGKSETVGKPLLYSTSTLFMDYFGINDKAELPKLNDVSTSENEIGEKAD
ncbi:SMC-Scp complex subunit ScpB [Rubrolithibacter danxiaensis]|uniref:SMC-Scp complex subunit ScpB n=1 Tax=Rubrolithibacter danxiaensis TaxID=3390805 RepID=UPI003BF8566E